MDQRPGDEDTKMERQVQKVVHPILAANARVDWMILILSSSLRSYGKKSSRMFSHNVHSRHGKDCNRRDSLLLSDMNSKAEELLISCSVNDSFG